METSDSNVLGDLTETHVALTERNTTMETKRERYKCCSSRLKVTLPRLKQTNDRAISRGKLASSV